LGNNKCSPQYTGERCAFCAKGFYRVNGECIKCPDSPWAIVIAFSLGAMFALGGAYFLNKKNVNLAIMNMLPFPVLDGGHITMAIYEWIRGKTPPLKLLETMQLACVLLLLSFVGFVSIKDVRGLKDDDSDDAVRITFAPPAPPAPATP
jgi:hypothetical protein